MNRFLRGGAAVWAVASAMACGQPTPMPDGAPDAADAIADSVPRGDVATDRVTPRPDAGMDAIADVTVVPDVSEVPDVVEDASADVNTASDAAPDVTDAGPVGCALPVESTLELPAPGMVTTVMTSLNAMGAGGMVPSLGCVSTAGGAERIFRFTVASRIGVSVRATAMSASTDLALAIRRSCASAASEVACNDDTSGTNPAIREILNPGEYFIVLDEFGPAAATTGGAATIELGTFTAAANGECAAAIPLTAGMTVTGDSNGGGAPSGSCSAFNVGRQVFYSYAVPANSTTTFTATPTGAPAWNPFVRVFGDCMSAGTCLTTASGPAGMPTVARLENRTPSVRNVIVSVGSTTAFNGGTFTLAATSVMLPPAPPNATCAMPQSLTLPATAVMGTTAAAFETRSSVSCASSPMGGPLVYYSAIVPAGRTVQFRVTPTGMTFNPSVRAFLGCAPASCADFRDVAGAGQPETLSYLNPTMADQTVLFAVGSTTAGQTGDFAVDARLLPSPPANTTCATARALTAGATPAQLQSDATETSRAACEPTATGSVLYYTLTVPAATRATITATPLSRLANPVLRLRESCATTACVASSDEAFSGSPESVTVTNAASAPVTYVLELGSSSASTRGAFDLDVQFAALPYAIATPAAASCDDLSMGAATLIAPAIDDGTSATTALPAGFAFRSFGEAATPITHVSANSNGFAQLYSSSAGVGTTMLSFLNLLLPSASAPPGVVAVFWDDLLTLPNGVRSATFGAAPARRFVIEWNSRFLSPMTETLRFQLKLFESTNVLEFHYCEMRSTAMSPPAALAGAGATVGLQNIARTRGLTYLHNGRDNGAPSGIPRAVGGGTASSPSLIRFTPL
jgi:hypothetical protein